MKNMIGTEVSKDAPAGSDSGFFTGGLSNYTKNIYFPEEWKEGYTGLGFDGVMMNATLDVNGSRVAQCHYGYAPFFVDLSDHVTFGKENRITVNVNTSMQPASRWYTGSGIYRSVSLMHGPRVHIVPDGVFVYTKDIADGYAFLEAVIDVENTGNSNRMAEVVISLYPEGSSNASGSSKVNTVTGTPSAAVNTSSVSITADAGETVNVVWIQSDAYKPGYQPAAAGSVGAGPEAQAK